MIFREPILRTLKKLLTELNSRTLTLTPNPNDPRSLTLTQYSVTNSLFSAPSMFSDYLSDTSSLFPSDQIAYFHVIYAQENASHGSRILRSAILIDFFSCFMYTHAWSVTCSTSTYHPTIGSAGSSTFGNTSFEPLFVTTVSFSNVPLLFLAFFAFAVKVGFGSTLSLLLSFSMPQ